MEPTFQRLFQKHYPAFAEERKQTRDMRHAAWMIRHCRTRELGGHVDSCPAGHFHRVVYHSCNHRCCPQCAWAARERWLNGWKRRLLPTGHHHIIFTVDHQLNPIWRYNKARFTDTLFRAVSQTLLQLLADPKYLGAKPGILAALHTWNQKLDVHLHLHVIVTAGGLAADTEGGLAWKTPKRKCLLPRKVLMLKFRGKFCALLRQHLQEGNLRLPTGMSRAEFGQLIWKCKRPWNVKIYNAYDQANGVATYLARYVKGGPMGKSRLLAFDNRRVHFRYRLSQLEGGNGKRQGEMSLPIAAFFARWLEHVPPRRLQTVRGYGLYSGNQHSGLATAREQFDYESIEDESEPPTSWQALCSQAGLDEACRCPQCGEMLVSHHPFPSGRSPPASAFVSTTREQAA